MKVVDLIGSFKTMVKDGESYFSKVFKLVNGFLEE